MAKKKQNHEEGEIIEIKDEEESEPLTDELENIIDESPQSMSTTFTPATSRSVKSISPSLEQNEIQDPIQNLETDLEEIPGSTTNQEEGPAYDPTKAYLETPTEESAQQLSDYQTQTPSESQPYDTPQRMTPLQRFDTATGVISGMQDEKRQFQQWQQAQGYPGENNSKMSENYIAPTERIDNSVNLPFKKNKKKNAWGF